MKVNRKAIGVCEAQRKIRSYIRLQHSVSVELQQAFGRRLAEDITASHPVPRFVKSGMDGFAVKSEDLYGATVEHPVILEVNQTIPCGSVPGLPVKKGQASRIMTGAPLPSGADTVVMFEMTEDRIIDGKPFVSIQKEAIKGKNVSHIGEEIEEKEFLCGRGSRINAGEAALLATFGHDKVNVFAKPRVAIFTTGSELLAINEPIAPGKIRNSNLFMLSSLVQEAGGELVYTAVLPDTKEEAKTMIYDTLDRAQLIITTGGVSVGDFDLMADFYAELQGQLLFNKVAMRPGSVTTAGVADNTLLFGLSGNPGACFVGFELFVRPVLYAMQGKQEPYPLQFQAYLKGDFTKASGYTRYVRGKTTFAHGCVFVEPVGKDQSSVTVSIKDADCLILIPPGGNGKQDGELVEAIKLDLIR
ncbi:gephyrin-like molybdotransferase Glp [Paenibacillus sp. MBLB4367]|uniref:molybdopterin molybdotransferase MoeA n=1 Tax=Paenibacillus sp. MBLB4367 TaxID=3384767 RepID=UPI00390818A3